MNFTDFEELSDPKNTAKREIIDRRNFIDFDQKIIKSVKDTLDLELKALHIQSLYDLDEYYFLLKTTFKDERDRPNLYLRSKISGHRIDIEWLRYWSFTDPITKHRQIYSRSFKKGKTCRHSMSGFARYPIELKKIINFIENRNEVKRKRGALLSKIFQLLNMYEKITAKDLY